MKLKTQKYNVTNIILLCLIAIQLCALFIFNMTKLPYESNFDSSAAMAQAMEIVKQKTLFLSDWEYQSTFGLDSVLPLAAVFYAVFHNIFIAYGLADFIGTIFFLYVIISTGKLLNIKNTYLYISCIFLLIPFSRGMLGYYPMMFTGAAYYLIKALLPILLISLVIRIRKGKMRLYHIPLVMILTWYSFFTGLSCGPYLLVCGFLPVLIWQLLLYVKNFRGKNSGDKNSISSRKIPMDIVLSAAAILVLVIGIQVAKVYNPYSFVNGMVLCNADNFFDNLFKFIIGFFELFSAVAYGTVSATSKEAILILMHLLIAMSFLVLMVKGFVHMAKNFKKCPVAQESSSFNETADYGFFAMIVLINYGVLILTYTTYGAQTYEYRYHIIPMIAGIFICLLGASHLENVFKPIVSKVVMTIVIIVMMYVSLSEFSSYYRIYNNSDCLKELSETLEANDFEVAYFVDFNNDKETDARVLRLFSDKLNIVYGSSYGDFKGWGTSTAFFDVNRIENSHYAVITTQSQPPASTNVLKYCYSIGEYNVYSK